MPARVSTRSTRTSAGSRKTSAQSSNTRTSTASRVSIPNVEVPEESPDSVLRTQVCAIFRDAQKTTASHRKLAVNLRKIQEACCYEPSSTSGKKTGAEDFDEEQFTEEVTRCVLRIMPVKKSESVGEKVVKFIALFLRHASDKDNELLQPEEDSEVMVETPTSRLTTHIMSTVLPLLMSKEKFVRYRATQLISNVINSLDSIDDDLFQLLRQGLLKRIRDKEAMVRVQAVLGLGRLAGNEVEDEENSEDSDGDANGGLLDKLLDVMQNDPSADVRRSLLINLPIMPKTLPYLLERARDQDPATRRALYSRLLPTLGDFRHLSLSMREKLLRWGLRDRDENVRKAAGKLFRERWIEDCIGSAEVPEGEEPAGPNFDALFELLERVDVVNSGVENGVALEAMKGFWEGRPDYRNAISFPELYWDTLTAESVFIARTFNDFCRFEGNGKYEKLLDKMPEVTRLAFYLQRYLNVLVEALKRVAQQEQEQEDDDAEADEDTVEQEFIVEQLLHIAGTLDYSDEVGRRKMFQLLRQTLAVPDLPEEVTKLTIDVLRGICTGDDAGEKEFCDIILEAVADVHDTIVDEPADVGDGEESFVSAKSEMSDGGTPARTMNEDEEVDEEAEQEKAIREIMVNMKCLHMVQCMLENVEGNLQKNVSLVSTLNNLVVPAVRSHEAPVRERGLVCLGLCALLDKSLAEENLTLFVHFFMKGHSTLQATALKIVTDILNQHGAQLLDSNPALLKVYIKALRSGAKTPEVQAAATLAVSKLLLGRVVQDKESCRDLLKTLVVAYFEPSTQTNQGVRQTLSYFLPVYSYTRPENQDLMRSVALDAIHSLFNIQENYDDEEEENDMVSLNTIGAHLVDWTDPRKCYTPGNAMSFADDSTKKAPNGDVHLELAQDILARLSANASKEEKKVVAQLLGKLYISPASSEDKLRETYSEVSIAVEDNLISDTTGRNALYKIHVSLGKIVNALGDKDKRTSRRSSSALPDPRESIDASDKPMATIEEDDDDDAQSVMTEPSNTMIKEEDDSDTGTVIAHGRRSNRSSARDSLVSELLSDDEDEL